MSNTKKCSACAYFENHNSVESLASSKIGLCRLNPPFIMETMAPVAQWPLVKSDDWCGKYSN